MSDPTLFQISTHLYTNTDLGMYYCGKRINTKNHSYGPEIRKHYLFVFVNSGKAVLHTDTQDIPFGTHDMLIMYPDEKIHYTTSTDWSIQWVGLYGKTVDYFMEQTKISRNHPIVPITVYKNMEKTLRELYNCAHENTYSTKIMQTSLIYNFFSILFEHVNTETQEDYVYKAKKIIDYNYNFITVETLSETLNLNPSYLCRIFTEKMGVSPKRYILNKKMERAKELLSTNASISAISNSIGFTDSFYFSRIFKKYEGISPSEYKKQLLSLK